MLTTSNIRDWLASLLPTDRIYAGSIDANQAQCIGVYQRDTGKWNQAIGAASTYQKFEGKLLIHWGQDIRICETKAAAVFQLLANNRKTTIATHPLADITLARPPIDVGRDSSGIWESVITFTVIYHV